MNARSALCALATIAGSIALAGCQDATKIGAFNECPTAIEVVADDVPPAEGSVPWTEIAPGSNAYIVSISTRASSFYVAVRTPGETGDGDLSEMQVSDLARASRSGAGYDLEVVIQGEGCP